MARSSAVLREEVVMRKIDGTLGSRISLKPEDFSRQVSQRLFAVWRRDLLLGVLLYVATVHLLFVVLTFVIELQISWPHLFAASLLSVVLAPALVCLAPFWAVHQIVSSFIDSSDGWVFGVTALVLATVTGMFAWYVRRVVESRVLQIYSILLGSLSTAGMIGWMAG